MYLTFLDFPSTILATTLGMSHGDMKTKCSDIEPSWQHFHFYLSSDKSMNLYFTGIIES